MKSCILLMMLCTLAGCTAPSPFPPDISGDLQPVNSPSVIQEVNNV